ncbi:MAG: hypothetical protein ABIZ04_21795 [Opitutus sp.]
MSSAEEGALPARCRLVPIVPGEVTDPVRLCVLVQEGAQKGQLPLPSLILICSSWLGRSYLGALADANNRIHAWLEIWVQASGAGTMLDESEARTNAELDARWQRWVSAFGNDSALIATGWEKIHPLPVWLDLQNARAVVPRDKESGAPFELCVDDAALMAAGLDSFSDSRQRYLAIRGRPGAGFIAPIGDAPSGARAVSEVLIMEGADLIPFNPEGGFLVVRRLAPLEWGAYTGLLSGRTFRGLVAGQPPVKLGGPYAALDDWDRLQQAGAHLFSTTRGRAGRFHETFHLKLLLLQSMLREVRASVAATQLPFLNLGPHAFRVDLSSSAGALPVLWTARAILAEPGVAIPLSAPGDLRYFKPATGFAPSIYRPEGAGREIRGRGELRIRKLMISDARIQMEATIVSPEVAAASPRDLVWVRLPLPGAGAFDLVGNIDAAEALAQGEARFRTAPMDVSQSVLATLRGFEGSVFPGTPFETIPLLSTPVDVFSLGVLGAQLFLTGSGKALPTALDELFSFVRAAETLDTADSPGEGFKKCAAADSRWTESLGPQHHGHGATIADGATGLLPSELWWDTLATLGRFFAGTGARPFCRDFGDAPSYQLEAAFDVPLAAIDALVLRSQSLLLCDWPSNREVARVIQKLR